MQKTASDPASLDNLHDIVVLDPVSVWPLAPGWYWIAWLLLIFLTIFTWSLVRKRRANRYRRVALVELDRLEVAVRDPERRISALTELPTLVKRVALAAWPREIVASLSGPSLLEFLDATGRTQAFRLGPGTCLSALLYDTRAAAALGDEHIAPLFGAVREWVKRHDPLSPSLLLHAPDLKSDSTGVKP